LKEKANEMKGGGDNFDISGTALLSGSAGGNSRQHLRVIINGTPYKIKLENDT
jgi:hypothetical protein